ncbi:hypothetical protein [Haladaptatus sp. QDMS2]|uniref:hypothetical protein n=1 Tax=Haladaptatus sp. QDMS2 TaxID=3033391 RepID=UPI0023E8C94B|nr:hypothetical protein [Haladaptatus sp. QDMS2]
MLYHLFEKGPALPSEISDSTDRPLPHISRSIAELRENNLVTLLVPEETQKGRLYGLTGDGKEIIWEVYRKNQDISFEFVDAAGFPYHDLLEYLLTNVDDELRGVVAYTQDGVSVYSHTPAVLEEYTNGQPTETITEVANEVLTDEREPATETVGDLNYTVQGYDELTLLRLPVADKQQVLVTFADSYQLRLPEVATQCRSYLP